MEMWCLRFWRPFDGLVEDGPVSTLTPPATPLSPLNRGILCVRQTWRLRFANQPDNSITAEKEIKQIGSSLHSSTVTHRSPKVAYRTFKCQSRCGSDSSWICQSQVFALAAVRLSKFAQQIKHTQSGLIVSQTIVSSSPSFSSFCRLVLIAAVWDDNFYKQMWCFSFLLHTFDEQ